MLGLGDCELHSKEMTETCSIVDQACVVLGLLTGSTWLVKYVHLQHPGSYSGAWTPSAGRRDVVLQETSDDI